MPAKTLTLFADYHQFYIQDDDIEYGDLSDAWTAEATDRLLAVAERVIGVGTVRDADVPVHISIADQLPALVPAEWDRINRATFYCETGRLVLAGCTDYFPDAERIPVAPGTYDVLVGYKNLGTVSEDGLEGDDSYHLFLAPAA